MLEQPWNLHAPGRVIDELRLGIGSPIKGILSSRLDHHLKLSDVVRSKRLRVNFDACNFKLTTHGDRHSATTSSTSKLACLQILLHFQQLLLHFLNFTHVHGRHSLLQRTRSIGPYRRTSLTFALNIAATFWTTW